LIVFHCIKFRVERPYRPI